MEKEQGFTLLEVIVVLAILLVGGASAAVSIRSSLPNWRLKEAAGNARSLMEKTRMSAIRSGENGLVCFEVDPTGTYYSSISCLDENGNFLCDAGEPVLYRERLESYRFVTLDGRITFWRNSAGQPSVGFNSRGCSITATGAWGMGTLPLVNSVGNRVAVVVSPASGVRISQGF